MIVPTILSESLQGKHRGQTSGMRVVINFDSPRANFPRKISKENIRNNRCLAS